MRLLLSLAVALGPASTIWRALQLVRGVLARASAAHEVTESSKAGKPSAPIELPIIIITVRLLDADVGALQLGHDLHACYVRADFAATPPTYQHSLEIGDTTKVHCARRSCCSPIPRAQLGAYEIGWCHLRLPKDVRRQGFDAFNHQQERWRLFSIGINRSTKRLSEIADHRHSNFKDLSGSAAHVFVSN